MLARLSAFFAVLTVMIVAGDNTAIGQATKLTWQNICEPSPCRFSRHGVRGAQISPDGRYVAVTASTPENEGIFLVSTTNGETEFWVEGSSPVWFDNGNQIVFSRDSDLWIVARGSDDADRITDDDDDERSAVPSPDGRYVGFYSGRGGHQDVWIVSTDGSSDPRPVTSESMPLDQFGFTFSWSPDGEHIAYYSNKAGFSDDDLWIVNLALGEERQLTDDVMGRSGPAWSPDGNLIAIMATHKSDFWYGDMAEIYLVDPDTGIETLVPMQIFATERGDLTWSGDGTELFFPYLQRAEMALWRVPSTGGVATRVTNAGGAFFNYDATADGDAFVFARSTPTRGSEVEYVTAEGGPLKTLTNFSNEWDGLVEPEEISFRSFDGLYIQGFLFRPPNFTEDGNYPALVQVHGGGTNSYYNGLNLVEQKLANSGYVVLAINYRGGSGFGREFQDLSINDWANGQAVDAAEAGKFLRAQPWSNGKVGIYGYSYGGITSMGAITRVPDAFDAAVPMAGIYDFADAYRTADRIGRMFTEAGHSGSPEERPKVYEISNSIIRIKNIETPVLLMHGEADVRAPFRQFGLAVEQLERHDKVFESQSFPNQPHGFRNPEYRIAMYERLEAWFDRWLK